MPFYRVSIVVCFEKIEARDEMEALDIVMTECVDEIMAAACVDEEVDEDED